jgi:prepilin-type N-terminal cleavage/methylation domain-containing protein
MRKGFTLIEALVVIAAMAIIAVFVIPNFLGGSHEADLNSTTQKIVSSLRQTQSQAADQTLGVQWGVHFANSTNTTPFYAVFSGSSYASGTVQSVYTLPSTIAFMTSTLPIGSTEDVIFNTVSGASNMSTTIKLYVVSQPALSSTVVIGGIGQIAGYTPTTPPPIPTQTVYAVISPSGGPTTHAQVLEFNPPSAYLSQVGCTTSNCDYAGGNDLFEYAHAVQFDANGNIWVLNQNTSQENITEFSPTGAYITEFGTLHSGGGSFEPVDMKIDSSGNFWVVDNVNNNVQEFNSSGFFVSQLGCSGSAGCASGSGNGQFNAPSGVAIDGNGNIWVLDGGNNRVEEFNASGTYLTSFGSMGSGSGQMNNPEGIAIDASGNIWVADFGNDRVDEFNASGTSPLQIGSFTNFGYSCAGSRGGFCGDGPSGVAVDANGNIWAADAVNYNLQEFSATGTPLSQISTLGYGAGFNSYLRGISVQPSARPGVPH